MSNMMEYKGYFGSVAYSNEDRVFHGKLEYIRDLVTFEGTDVESLERAFKEAVDDYLDLCRTEGKTPDKPYKGVFNVRTKPETHRRLVMLAALRKKNLNALVEDAFQYFLKHKDDGRHKNNH